MSTHLEEIKPETLRRLTETASKINLGADALLNTLLDGVDIAPEIANRHSEKTYDTMTPEERAQAWEEWANSHAHVKGPKFLDDSRESIYREREDSQL